MNECDDIVTKVTLCMLRNRLHRHLAYKQNLIERSWYWIFKKSGLQSWGDLPYFVRKTLCRQYVGWSNTLISKDLDPFDTSGYLNLLDVKSINLYFKNCKYWKIYSLYYRKMSFKKLSSKKSKAKIENLQ